MKKNTILAGNNGRPDSANDDQRPDQGPAYQVTEDKNVYDTDKTGRTAIVAGLHQKPSSANKDQDPTHGPGIK